jgi:hypothetical protein
VPRCITHLFGNPAILNDRTRGFASPDFSGFALSENLFVTEVKSLEQLLVQKVFQ